MRKVTDEQYEAVYEVINRYVWPRWESKHQCEINARVSRGKYRCAHCKKLVGPKEKHIDHIEPRIDPVKGRETVDELVIRSLPDLDGLQCLCIPCHKLKTKTENATRRKKKK